MFSTVNAFSTEVIMADDGLACHNDSEGDMEARALPASDSVAHTAS